MRAGLITALAANVCSAALAYGAMSRYDTPPYNTPPGSELGLAETIEFSVVAPVHDEAGNAPALAREIAAALDGRAYEMIFVDDCSRDDTRHELAALKRELPALRLLGHRSNSGQSRAVRTGVLAARAPIVGTLDGDGQNDPADLPRLLARLTRPDAPANLGMVAGNRAKRQDKWSKRAASRIANNIRKAALKDGAIDSGSGVKVFKREAFLKLPYFDHMHRFMPALMLREGFAVEFLEVNHRPRGAGRSKYTNLGRLAANMTDLFGVMWLRSRARLPGGVDEL